jgi:hypothetical protein
VSTNLTPLSRASGVSKSVPGSLSWADPPTQQIKESPTFIQAARATPTRPEIVSPGSAGPDPGGHSVVAPAIQSEESSLSPRLAEQQSWGGLDYAKGVAVPPNDAIAVGNGYVVEIVNHWVEVWDTQGGFVSDYPAGSLFPSEPLGNGGLSDPMVHFDPVSQQFFAIMESTDSMPLVCTDYLSVTSDSNPSQPSLWYDYVLQTPNGCGDDLDHPSIGMDDSLVVVAGQATSGVFILDKDDLVNGEPNSGGMIPNNCESASPACEWWAAGTKQNPVGLGTIPLAAEDSSSMVYLAGLGQGTQLTVYTITGAPESPTITAYLQPTYSGSYIQYVPQPGSVSGGGLNLDDGNENLRIDSGTVSGPFLWLGLTAACGSQDCAEIIQIGISDLSSPNSVIRNVQFGDGNSGDWTFFTGIAATPSGFAGFIFGASSSTDYPDLWVGEMDGYSPADTNPTVEEVPLSSTGSAGNVLCQSGNGAAGGCRWGDMFETAVDPASFSSEYGPNFYGVGEYVPYANDNDLWTTEIDEFSPATASLSVGVSSVDLGQSISIDGSFPLADDQCASSTASGCWASVTLQYCSLGSGSTCSSPTTYSVGCLLAIPGDPDDTFPISITPSQTGTWVVGTADGISSYVTVWVVPKPYPVSCGTEVSIESDTVYLNPEVVAVYSDPQVCSVLTSPVEADLGAGDTLTADYYQTCGGSPAPAEPESFTWSWSPAGALTACSDVSGNGGLSESSIACVASAVGTVAITVGFVDIDGESATDAQHPFEVTILSDPTVAPPMMSPGSCSPNCVADSNVPEVFSSSAAEGGAGGPFEYAFEFAIQGCSESCMGGCPGNFFSSSTTYSCTLEAVTSPVAVTVTVVVFDTSGGGYGSNSLTFTEYPDPSVSLPTSATQSGGIDVGQSVTFTSGITYQGSGADTLGWTVSSTTSPPMDFGCGSSVTTTISCSPTASGTYQVTITVTDQGQGAGSATSAAFIVEDAPSLTSPVYLSPLSLDVGQTTSGFVTITDPGSGTFGSDTFSWSFSPGGNGCSGTAPDYQGLASVSCTPTAAGTYAVTATLEDPNHDTVTSSSQPIIVSADPLGSGAHPTKSSVDVGQAFMFDISVSGGLGPFTISWSGYAAGSGCSSSTTGSISCTPTAAGTYTISYSGVDSNGCYIGTSSATCASSATTFTSATFTVDSDPLFGGVAIVPSVAAYGAGYAPWGLYIDSGTNGLHIAFALSDGNGNGEDNLVEVNLTSNHTLRSFATGLVEPRTLWFDAANGEIWVAGGLSDVVDAFNWQSGALIVSISVPGDPTGLVSDPNHNALWVSEFEGSAVAEVSLSSDSVVATISTGSSSYPYFDTIDPTTNLLFVTDSSGSNDVFIISTASASLVNTATLPTSPYAQDVVSVLDGYVFVTSYGASTISEFPEGNPSAVTTIAAPSGAWGLAYDPVLDLLAVGSLSGSSVQFYCASTYAPLPVLAPVPSVASVYGVDFDPVLNLLAFESVPSYGAGTLQTFNVANLAGDCPASMVQGIPHASPPSIDLGQTSYIDIGQLTGGSGGYIVTFNVQGPSNSNTAGCVAQAGHAGQVDPQLCTPTETGLYFFSYTATDSNGFTVNSQTLVLRVSPDPLAGEPEGSVPAAQSDVGQSVTFSVNITGGAPDATFVWYDLPPGCSSVNADNLTCAPTTAGTYTIYVVYTDSNNYTVTSPTFTFTVISALVVGAITPSADSFGVGQPFTLLVAVSGGSGVYTYAWSVSDSGLGCTLANASTISCDPTSLGSYTASVTVTDTNANSITPATLEISVMNWNSGTLCSVSNGNCQFTGSSHCAPALGYAFNGSYQTLKVRITGSSDCVFLNVSGSHDVIDITVTGSSLPYLQVILAGWYDFVNLDVVGSSNSAFVYLFGAYDTYNLTATGSSLIAQTYFLGFTPGNDSAPDQNLSNTDAYHLSIIGSNDNQYLTWVNSVGWSSVANTVKAPHNIATGSSDYLSYQNLTGVWAAPWDSSSGLPSFIPSTPTGAIPAGNPP